MLAAQTKMAVAAASGSDLVASRISWRDIVEPVQPFMDAVARRLSDQVQAFEPEIVRYAEYALTNQGKQLRPALVALSGRAAGHPNETLVTVAVIIEMVHLATLVHDDVMDAAEIRRRRPTLAANWGNTISVLLGDCLFAQALQLAASFPTPEICRAVAEATNRVCAGEILQTLHSKDFALPRLQYFRVLQMKTAELFALSCDLGAVLGGAKPGQRAALRSYGLMLGTAYQVYDDCLDLFGSEALAGKSLGTDLANGKLTLPVLLALERASESDLSQIKELIQSWNRDGLELLLPFLAKYRTLEASGAIIYEYLGLAREALAEAPDTESRSAMIALTEFLAQQTHALGVESQ